MLSAVLSASLLGAGSSSVQTPACLSEAQPLYWVGSWEHSSMPLCPSLIIVHGLECIITSDGK